MKTRIFADAAGLLKTLVRHRGLIFRLAQREVLTRYRGSFFGLAWALLLPLFMLGVYTFVFTEIFQARWGLEESSRGVFALAIFSGLIFYTLFAESALKAPGLMTANASYITKIVFPLEILPVVSVLATLFNALASIVVLALGLLVLTGGVSTTFPYVFLMLVPLGMVCLGVSWILSALGVYIRDIGLVVSPIVTGLLFLTPVLYPLEQAPERWQAVISLLPLTYMIESSRGAALMGRSPEMGEFFLITAGAILFALFSFLAFNKARKGFADVI